MRVCSHRLQQRFPAWQKAIQDTGFPATPCSQSGERLENWESRDPRRSLVPRGVACEGEGSKAEGNQTQTIKVPIPWLSPHPHHYRMKSRGALQRALV